MARFETRGELRKTAETAFGRPFSPEEWARWNPKHEPDYDQADLAGVLKRARRARKTQEVVGADRLLRALGVDDGSRLVNDYLIAVAGADDIVLLGGAKPVMSEQEFATVGKVIVGCAAAVLLASRHHANIEDVLATAFGLRGGRVLAPLVHDAVSEVARSARAGATSGWTVALKLHWADVSINRELHEWRLMELLTGTDSSKRLERLGRRGNVPFVSAEDRWLVYEREHAWRVGRTYKTAAAYKQAVYRARKRIDDFMALHRPPKRVPVGT